MVNMTYHKSVDFYQNEDGDYEPWFDDQEEHVLTIGEINEIEETCDLMVDSGSTVHVCPKEFGEEYGLIPSQKALYGVSGNKLTHNGTRTIPMLIGGNVKASVTLDVAGVKRPVLSVSRLVDQGCEISFRDQECHP